jgi:hypothetical protein
MAAKLTRLTHKIVIQLHLVAESYTIYSSSSKRPVRKLLDTPSYIITNDIFSAGCHNTDNTTHYTNLRGVPEVIILTFEIVS